MHTINITKIIKKSLIVYTIGSIFLTIFSLIVVDSAVDSKIFGALKGQIHSCSWITTSCGQGCSDNKDLYNCQSFQSGNSGVFQHNTFNEEKVNPVTNQQNTSGCGVKGTIDSQNSRVCTNEGWMAYNPSTSTGEFKNTNTSTSNNSSSSTGSSTSTGTRGVPITSNNAYCGSNGTCTAPTNGCIAIHDCDKSNGMKECTELSPELKGAGSSINAQDEANRTCKCVQVDILNGASGSCNNGHINEVPSTLIGHAIACPDSTATHCSATKTTTTATNVQTLASNNTNNPVTPPEPPTPVNTPSFTISKTVSEADGSVNVGDRYTYWIRIYNNGNTTFQTVQFEDDFQNIYQTVNLTNSRMNNSVGTSITNLNPEATLTNSNKITISDLTQYLGDLAPSQYFDLVFEFTAVTPTSDTDNIATARAGGITKQATDDIAIVGSASNPSLDVTKTLQDSNGVVEVGDEFNFLIRITNTGNTTFQNVYFEDTFNSTYITPILSASSIRKSGGNSITNLNGEVTLTNGRMTISDITTYLGDLPSGGFYELDLRFRARAQISSTVNYATATADGITDSGNDDVTIIVDANPSLNVTKVLDDDDGQVNVGDKFTFTIRIQNNGDTEFDQVRFLDFFDSTYISPVISESRIRKNNGTSSNLSTMAQLVGTNQIVINDITEFLGNLRPTEYYSLTIVYTALRTTIDTDNIVRVTADTITDEGEDDVTIVNQQITTRTCNQTCNTTNLLCDGNAGLTCNFISGLGNVCRLPSNVTSATCEGQYNPNLGITKNAILDEDGDKTYVVNDEITFDIVISNTGDRNLDNVRFIDNYDSAFLSFKGGSAIKRNGLTKTTLTNLNNILSVNNVNATNYFAIENLALTSLGNLNIREEYVITLRFTALKPGTTTNYSFTETVGLPRIQAQDTVQIVNIDTDM